MPDYIYLLEHRLNAAQQNALRLVRDRAREAQMTVFLAGDAVRDLTSGHPVRDLELVVHGNALDLRKAIEAAGGAVWGQDEATRTLSFYFPGSVRLDVASARKTEFPKPGKPVHHWASIQEDLRRRDFTVNAMALSLNEGSYGLLMDPMNGVADMEARALRLVSNYGFLEDPILLVRATRLKARLGWELEERSQTRYENARGEEVIEHASPQSIGEELERIAHEEEPLKVLAALEAEGWMKFLFPAWTVAKADVDKLKELHDLAIELAVQGVHPDLAAPQMQLLTAKFAAKELAALKKLLPRPGFVAEWDNLDALAAGFAKALLSKEHAAPSAAYRLMTSYDAEAVLWLGFTSKDKAVREKYQLFLKEWPQSRQRIPYALMQEMRIVQEMPVYAELVQTIFLGLIDGQLTTIEEMRALLEPHSPPAPPPPVPIKRTRGRKGEAKRASDLEDDEVESEDGEEIDEDLEEIDADDMSVAFDGGDPDLIVDLVPDEADVEADAEVAEDLDVGDDETDDEPVKPAPAKKSAKGKAEPKRSSKK